MADAGRTRRARGAAVLLLAAGLAAAGCTRVNPAQSAFIQKGLTDSDAEMMVATAQRALEETAAGATMRWGNPESGHFGTVTALEETTREGGRPCRDFEQTATVRGRTGLARRTACRDADGTWRLADSEARAGTVTEWALPPPSEEGYELPDYVRGPGYISGYPYFIGLPAAGAGR